MYQYTVIAGNVGRDPEMRYTQSGQAVCDFSVAVNRRWTDRQSNADHFVRHGHLEIHMCTKNLADLVEIAVLDMPPILAQMNGYAVGSGMLGDKGRLGRARVTGTTRLAQCCDMVDVDPEVNWVITAH